MPVQENVHPTLYTHDSCAQSTSKSEPNNLNGIYSEEWDGWRRKESANYVTLLKTREIDGLPRKKTPFHKLNNDLFTAMPMHRASITEMTDKDYILSWTPDGRHLICVSAHGNAIKVNNYLGVQNTRNELQDCRVISKLFQLDFQVNPQFAHGFAILLDTIYFTSCGRFFLFAANRNAPVPQGYIDVYQNNESLTPLPNSLDDLTIYVVDIQEGVIADERSFYMDKIVLSTCVSISGHIVLVTSPVNQIMYIMRIHVETGKLSCLKEIGPAVRDVEEVYAQIQSERAENMENQFYTGLKQRIMSFLFIRAKKEKRTMEMLRSLAYYESLRIYSTYLFEKFYVLIRMMPKDWNMKTAASPCFFVIMDWREATILDIFEEFDERFQEFTTKARLSLTFPLTSPAWVGASNYPKHADRMLGQPDKPDKEEASKADKANEKLNNCQAEICKKLLNQLPFGGHTQYKISLQSPYLDPNNFQIAQKIFAGIFSGKLRTDQENPRFMVTRTKKASFQLALSVLAHLGINVVSLLFHPQDPLCLVIDRTRMKPTIVVFQPGLERECRPPMPVPEPSSDSEESDVEETDDAGHQDNHN